jgi:predicted ArsR family transcriptional regulator
MCRPMPSTQADIAEQLKIDEKTLRKHFRDELSSGKFKVDMTAGKTVAELMKSRDEGASPSP